MIDDVERFFWVGWLLGLATFYVYNKIAEWQAEKDLKEQEAFYK